MIVKLKSHIARNVQIKKAVEIALSVKEEIKISVQTSIALLGFVAQPLPAPVLSASTLSLTSNSVSWSNVPGAIGYRVEKFITSWQVLSETTELQLTDIAAEPGQAISYRVKALGDIATVLDSENSNIVEVITLDFHPRYRLVINKAIELNFNLPILADRLKQNDLMIALVNNAIITVLDLMYVLSVPTTSPNVKDFTRINWVNPDKHLATYVGTVLHLGKQGIQTELTNYIDSNFILIQDKVFYATSNAGIFVHQLNDYTSSSPMLGIDGSTVNTRRTYFSPKTAANTGALSLNSPGGTYTESGATPAGLHHLYVNLEGSTRAERYFRNSTMRIQRSRTPTNPSDQLLSIPFGTYRGNSGAIQGTTPQCRFTVIGLGASLATKELLLHQTWYNYYNSIT